MSEIISPTHFGGVVRGARCNLAGLAFGKLRVVREYDCDGTGRKWICRCLCGSTAVFRTSALTRGKKTSCGCDKRKGKKRRRLHKTQLALAGPPRKVKVEPPPRRSPPVAGFVYVVRAGGMCKIGIAKNVENRLSQLATACPFPIELIHKIQTNDMRGLEKQLHTRFGDRRRNREWFELCGDDIAGLVSL